MTNEAVVTIDLHGKNAFQARVILDGALRRAGGAYRIRVVHGYHMGKTLSELVRTQYAAHPKVLRVLAVSDGITELVLREL